MPNLRERRRLQTAQEIQQATLALITEKGFENVTTLEISQHLGISPRTFFNYYANKESALMGPEMSMPEQDIETFMKNEAGFYESIRQLMLANTLALEPHRHELLVAQEVMQDHPRLSQIRLVRMGKMRDQLSRVLAEKYPEYPPLTLNILADVLLSSGWSGVELWLGSDISLEDAFQQSWQSLTQISSLLSEN
ncbi:TetR/AcrR family transcriptional regulator [Marinomonas sp.]